MAEFNPDGSLKLPAHFVRSKQEKEEKMRKGSCILVRKELVSFAAPKRCVLHIILSDGISDNRFIENIYKYFCENSTVPTKISKINEKEFDIEIGTDFKRCSDCSNLISRFSEFIDDNIIEENGNCTFERRPRNSNFCYQDHFE